MSGKPSVLFVCVHNASSTTRQVKTSTTYGPSATKSGGGLSALISDLRPIRST